MKINVILLIIISMIIGTANGIIPNEEWNKTYNTFGFDNDASPFSVATYVQQTIDGGYIITGYSGSYYQRSDAWLMKTDKNGNELWYKTFGGIDVDEFYYVQETSDGGYILAGVYGYDNTNKKMWLVKTDPYGNEQWSNIFGGIASASSVLETEDGYIALGYINNEGWDTLLLKVDKFGNELWNKTFGKKQGQDIGNAFQKIPGGYIILGSTTSFGAYIDENIWLIKTDDNGNELWNKTFGWEWDSRGCCSGYSGDLGRSIQVVSDGYIILGITGYYDGEGYKPLLIKTDFDGNKKWEKIYRDNIIYDNRYATYIQKTYDNGFIIVGFNGPSDFYNPPWIFKTDLNGNKIWSKNLGDTWKDKIMSVQQTTDKGFILTGQKYLENKGGRAWLIKLSNENIGPVHNINKGINYTTIQTAIDDANVGDTIEVDSGIYYENVNVNKQLVLRGIDNGNGKPVIDANNIGTGINIVVDGVTIKEFKITNASDGIHLYSSNRNNIINNTINSNSRHGIFLETSRYNTLYNNIVSNTDYGILIGYSSNYNFLNKNNASNNEQGINIGNSYNNVMTDNSISNNYFGIVTSYSRDNNISNNIADFNSDSGIYMGVSSYNNTLNFNKVSHNYYGIFLADSSEYIGNKLHNNQIFKNRKGITLWNVDNNILTKNNITSNYDSGIYIFNSINNMIYDNYFNNTENYYIDYSKINDNIWNATRIYGRNIVEGPYIGGNFWTNPSNNGYSNTCIADFDRICEMKYKLNVTNDNNIDYLPLTMKDNKPPASISNLKNLSYINYINWTWTDPTISDFSKVMIYINGVFKTNVTKGTKYYKAINLAPDTLYKISTHTIDISGNINLTWVNQTTRTKKDNIPPASITNLINITYKRNYINWTWTDPSTSDFSKVMIYINGALKTNVTKGKRYYNSTGLYPNAYYRISTHTVDIYGNINKTWVNRTAKTAS